MLYHGIGTTLDLKEAFLHYKTAADNGHVQAMCNLGVCYRNGFGVDKDNNKAEECYRSAAKQVRLKIFILFAHTTVF